MWGVGSHNSIRRRIQPEAFRLPKKGEAFVPGDISGWSGFEILAGESVDSLARRWFSSPELYLCMYTALPEFERPRYSGRAAGCRLEKVPLSCAWGKSTGRKAGALTQKRLTLRRVTMQWLRAQDSAAQDKDAAIRSAVARMEEVGSVWT
eukprot:672398-Pyramimonas_sp.AAC.1